MAVKKAKMAKEGEISNFVNLPFEISFWVSFWFCKKIQAGLYLMPEKNYLK